MEHMAKASTQRPRTTHGGAPVFLLVSVLVASLALPARAQQTQQRARPSNGASLPVRTFPTSIFNLPTRTNGSGVLKLPPTPPAPPPKKKPAAPKPKPVYARVIAARTSRVNKTGTKTGTKTTPRKSVPKTKRKGTVTTEPPVVDTTVPAPYIPPVDPVAASSGQCAGVASTALAPTFLVNFNVEAVDPAAWCQLLSGDANRILRFAPEVHIDWPALALNDYFRSHLTGIVAGIGRDAIVHAGVVGTWSEVAVLLPGGRLFIASSLRGEEDARALAEAVQSLSPVVDPVSLSVGDCPGPVTSMALAGFTKQVFIYRANLESEADGKRCLLASEDGLTLVSVGREPGDPYSNVRVDNDYWTEIEPGVGRAAIYHAPSSPADLHGVGFKIREWDFDVFAPSRERARNLALELVRTV